MNCTSPALGNALPALEKQIPALMAEQGFADDTPDVDRPESARLSWTFTNVEGDQISVASGDGRAQWDGFTPCFRLADQGAG